MDYVARRYNYYMDEASDPRVKGWVTFSGLFYPIVIALAYLVLVVKVLPRFMENRKAYGLKNVIYYYNLFQIVVNAAVIISFMSCGMVLGCHPVDYSDNYLARRSLNTMYYLHIIKAIDFIETVFFILRKKTNQVSFLHLYHHASTYFLSWVCCKYVGGGMAMVPISINCAIHVIMYSYYLLASLGRPEWQSALNIWKKRLTTIQMIQFGLCLAHALQSFQPDCNIAKQLNALYIPFLLGNTFLFWKFYKDNYIKAQEKAAKNQ